MNRLSPGLALIVVVGVLGVLSVVAAAFVTMAQLERKASQQRVNAERAYLLAKSGIEDAAARLALGQDASYGGEDWDADGKLSTLEAAQETYHVTGAGTLPDTDACPVRHAMRPSFFAVNMADVDRRPLLVSVDNKQRGYTGKLTGDAQRDGDTYAVKVATGGFYVNSGDPMTPTTPGAPPAVPANYNDVLKRILGTLAEAIDQDVQPDGTLSPNDGIPVDETDGWNLIDQRPKTREGWLSFEQIRDLALGGDQAKLDALKPYLTLHAWVDKRVIRPNATMGLVDNVFQSWADIKLAHGGAPALEPRAPVDLAWARKHRPALIALLAGLRGLYLDESTQTPAGPEALNDRVGTLREAVIDNVWSEGDSCHIAADAILVGTGELATWQEWNDFCDAVPFTATSSDPTATSDLRQAMHDILKANFNPNSDLNKFNPNPSLWKTVDKSDLLAYSTEFSLVSLQGKDVESVGRVLSPNGRLLAGRTLRASLAGPSTARLSTQNDFVCDDLGSLDAPGDESIPRMPGHPRFVSQSQASYRTWGERLDIRGLSPRADYASSWMDGNSQGASLQSYPEPCFNPTPGSNAGLSIHPADYDGNLQLATIDTPKDDWYGVNTQRPSPPGVEMGMLASFDDSLDLDVAKSGDKALVPDAKQAPVSNPLLDASAPNLLYPDGCYSERDRIPAWHDRRSAHGFHGVMSFWVKPNYSRVASDSSWGRGRCYVDAIGYHSWDTTLGQPNQFFFVGDVPSVDASVPGRAFVAMFEIGQGGPPQEREFYTSPRATLAHRWYLITFGWDFHPGDPNGTGNLPTPGHFNDCGELLVDAGGTGSEGPDCGPDNVYHLWPGAEYGGPADLTADDMFGGHLLCLGRRQRVDLPNFDATDTIIGTGADATFDEFALYDFGGASRPGGLLPAGTAQSYATLAKARYPEGRYYKGAAYKAADAPALPVVADEAASYLTAPITLPPGSVLRKIAWTWLRSSDVALAQDYVQVELVTPAGNQYLWPGSASNGTTDGARQVWTVNQAIPRDFRSRVVFLRPTVAQGGPDLANTPILDSPVFDDLTFLYEPVGGSRVLTWGDGT